MGPRALALTARCADGWEASYLSPADFAMRWQRGAPLDPLIDRFRAARGIERGHPLLDTILAGDGEAIDDRMAGYGAVGATDLMLGFADFPSTGMLEAFAASLLHGRSPAC